MSETSQEITKSDFSLTAKIFHWSFVILFAYGISKQIDNINQLEDLALLKFEIAFAFLFILFLVVRFFYMTKTQKSSLPQNTPKIQKINLEKLKDENLKNERLNFETKWNFFNNIRTTIAFFVSLTLLIFLTIS